VAYKASACTLLENRRVLFFALFYLRKSTDQAFSANFRNVPMYNPHFLCCCIPL